MSESDEINLWCWVLGDKLSRIFGVSIKRSATIGNLKRAIQGRKPSFKDIATDSIELFKFQLPLESFNEDCAQSIKLEDSQRLKSWKQISFYWMDHPAEEVLSVILSHPAGTTMTPSSSNSFSTSASLKHPRSSPVRDDDHEVKRKRIAPQRKWTVNGAIREDEAKYFYYLDPGAQQESKNCLDAVSNGNFLLLAGARASGKSTRLLWLQQRLEVMGHWPLYVSFEGVLFHHGTKEFWESFGTAVDAAAYRRGSPKRPTTPISSGSQFLNYFRLEFWNCERKVVLLIDEFSKLYEATSVRDDCLQILRTLKQSPSYALQCLIAAGTFSIVYLNPSPAITLSPFNIASVVQSPYFSMDETKKLFHAFAEDRGNLIDNDIVKDIWAKSNGHPGMVCLCGRTIYKNLETLVEIHSHRTISYRRWQQFPVEDLYSEIASYNTFDAMIRSLSRREAYPSLFLLRSLFVGFLDEVQLNNQTEEDLANFLTSEGVLLKPDPAKARYRMASALVDGVIRNRLIPVQFRDAPSSPLPLQMDGVQIDILNILIESLKFFDKNLIYQASFRSYKKTKVTIRGSPGGHVPRESVYDTELMRVLSNWLGAKYGWTVTGQWHLRNHLKKNKYSNIVIKKEENLTVVFELLATGEPSFVLSHIEKTPEYKKLLSADEAWVVHFTCEKDYCPIWQSDKHLSDNINVVHFAHNFEFSEVLVSARWKDCANNVHKIVNQLLKII